MWLSLVEYLNGVQGAGGSNPLTPTIFIGFKELSGSFFSGFISFRGYNTTKCTSVVHALPVYSAAHLKGRVKGASAAKRTLDAD